MKKNATILLLLLAAVCIWAAGSRNKTLSAGRMRELPGGELRDAPPLMAFTTVVLGGFRGLIADILWLRASYLQDRGKYFELAQLADWVTKMEPHFTQVWAFNAWNMAYNVSVMMSDAEDRWRWVQNGIRLLRDEGIAFNSADPLLYCELGWIFQHKIGEDMDPAHMTYKRRWAAEMNAVLVDPFQPDYAALEADSERLRRLREEFRMRPELMREVDAAYGPFDWRLPESHAVYWAWLGRRLPDPGELGLLRCDRMIYQCVARSFFRGALTYVPGTGSYATTVRHDLLPKAIAAFDAASAAHAEESIREAHMYFLYGAVFALHWTGHGSTARALFDRLAGQFPAPETADGFEAFIDNPRVRASLPYVVRRVRNQAGGDGP